MDERVARQVGGFSVREEALTKPWVCKDCEDLGLGLSHVTEPVTDRLLGAV